MEGIEPFGRVVGGLGGRKGGSVWEVWFAEEARG